MESSVILLETQPLFDAGLQIQMPPVGNIEPFAETPDQRIGMHRPPGNEIGGGKVQMHLDFRDPADRIGRIRSGKIQPAVFRIEKRHVQPQSLIAESERSVKLRTEIHRIRHQITQPAV